MHKYTPYIIDNIDYLNRLAKTKSARKKHTLLLEATSDQILSIVEITANVLKSNFTLTNKQKQRLAKYADFYRSIARSRTERTARNRLQSGGQVAIGALLAPVLSVIAQSLLDKALKK
jgi:hypothetical protein